MRLFYDEKNERWVLDVIRNKFNMVFDWQGKRNWFNIINIGFYYEPNFKGWEMNIIGFTILGLAIEFVFKKYGNNKNTNS